MSSRRPRSSRRSLRRALLGVLAGVLGLAALLVAPVPAIAAPVANPDSYTVYSGGTYTLTPIANDGKTLLSFGDLSLCGVASSDPRVVYIEQVEDTLVVELRRGAGGTSVIQYDVCQGSERRTGTITLTLVAVTELKATKRAGVRGQVVFRNAGNVPLSVTYGGASNGRPDATRTVTAGGSLTVATRRTSLYWVARYVDGDLSILAGDATLRSVQSRA